MLEQGKNTCSADDNSHSCSTNSIDPSIDHSPLVDCPQEYFLPERFLDEPRLPRQRTLIKCTVRSRNDGRICRRRGAALYTNDITDLKEAGINLLDFKSDVDWFHVAFQASVTFLEVIVAGIAGWIRTVGGCGAQEKCFGGTKQAKGGYGIGSASLAICFQIAAWVNKFVNKVIVNEYYMKYQLPASRNIVKNTTESKYVVVSPDPDGDAGSAAARPMSAMDERYATETPVETYNHPS
jgi:hypothetical protein